MVEWKISAEPVAYEEALAFMDARVADIHAGRAPECVWLLEHPPLYTAGTSAQEADLLDRRFPVYKAGRGGQYTYHGPGQRIAYVMMDLKKRCGPPDVKRYVCDLEEWIIRTVGEFGIRGERRKDRIGIWISPPYPPASGRGETAYAVSGGEKKIAAIGVRVRHWITLHGIAINVDPDLSHFNGIVPCGISDAGVTSMKELLGYDVAMDEVDEALRAKWKDVFLSEQISGNIEKQECQRQADSKKYGGL